MGKRLIVLLAVAFVALAVTGAYAEVQNVKVSGDLTVYGIMREMSLDNDQFVGDLNADGDTTDVGEYGSRDKHQSLATITRVKVDADLTDNVMTTVRLINERYWGSQDETTTDTDIDLDLALVTLKEFLYSPATLTVGRQELYYGTGMVIADSRPDTNIVNSLGSDPDLSKRTAFDAIRLVLNYDPLVIDVIAAKVEENTTNLEDDQNLYGVNAKTDINDMVMVEGYWFQKTLQKKNAANLQNKVDETETVGAHLVLKPLDTVTVNMEGAYQFGQVAVAATSAAEPISMAKRSAWAAQTAVAFSPKDVKYSPTFQGMYAFFSGNKGNTEDKVTAWDPMYEGQVCGHIANALFPQSNAHMVGLAATVAPMEDLTLKGEYYAYWWAKKYGDGQALTTVRGDGIFMEDQKCAGSEWDLTATYDYTEDVQFGLLGGIFVPNSSFSSRTDNVATEVIGSMKVSF